MTPEQLAQILSQSKEGELRSPLDVLDEPELEVFSLLAQGYSRGQIHSEFGIAPEQLKKLKQSMKTKLKLRSEVELLQFAVKQTRVQ